jgi:hypothetical protein
MYGVGSVREQKMFEAEVNHVTAGAEEIPPESRDAFASFARDVVRRSSLPWGEHCTECAWPTCYENCTLYTPRADLKCQRFVDGMVAIDFDQGVSPYLLKITFKRWAKLHAPGSVAVTETGASRAAEQDDLRRARLLRFLPGNARQRITRSRRRYVAKRDSVVPMAMTPDGPTHFAIECHNPNDQALDLSVFMGPADKTEAVPFERKVTAAPGYNRILIEISDIERKVDFAAPFIVEITPNHD